MCFFVYYVDSTNCVWRERSCGRVTSGPWRKSRSPTKPPTTSPNHGGEVGAQYRFKNLAPYWNLPKYFKIIHTKRKAAIWINVTGRCFLIVFTFKKCIANEVAMAKKQNVIWSLVTHMLSFCLKWTQELEVNFDKKMGIENQKSNSVVTHVKFLINPHHLGGDIHFT